MGDGAFPLRPWIAKAYGDAVLSAEKRYFNYRESGARMVTDGAFGRVKSKFRVLHKKCQSEKETVKGMALACIVMYNICIGRGGLIPRVFDLSYDYSQ